MVDDRHAPAAGEVLLVTRDPLVADRLRAGCAARGFRVVESRVELSMPPSVVAADLADPLTLASVSDWRQAWPDALLAGHLALPDRAIWLAAEEAGFDLVVNRGAFVGAVLRRLDSPREPSRRRYPLIASADVAGRLGCVLRLEDSAVGPLALYHIGKQFYAIADRCPHAGARLSDGELVGSVLTCPEHGSQFDLKTGERLRGPADDSPQRYSLVEEGGQVYLLGDG